MYFPRGNLFLIEYNFMKKYFLCGLTHGSKNYVPSTKIIVMRTVY